MGTKAITKPKEYITTSISLPNTIKDRVEVIAKESHRSFSGQISFFLEQALLRHNMPR